MNNLICTALPTGGLALGHSTTKKIVQLRVRDFNTFDTGKRKM